MTPHFSWCAPAAQKNNNKKAANFHMEAKMLKAAMHQIAQIWWTIHT